MEGEIIEKICDLYYHIQRRNEEIGENLRALNKYKKIGINKFEENIKLLANRIKIASEEIIILLSK